MLPPLKTHLQANPSGLEILQIRHGLQKHNVEQVPGLLDLVAANYAVIARDGMGEIIGGAICEIDWGWLFVDTLWVTDSQRGTGLGRAILNRAEQHALSLGIHGVYLMTTSFQALNFYLKTGYVQFGAVPDRPPGHTLYFLKKHITPQAIDPRVELDLTPAPDTLRTLENGLLEYSARTAPILPQVYAIFLEAEGQGAYGGIVCMHFWGWADVRFLWIAPEARGQGYGLRLLAEAEAEAKDRQLLGVMLDTGDWQAPTLYERAGFNTFGILDDRPPRHQSYFMQKRF